MLHADGCTRTVDLDLPRPKDIPPLLWNLRLHEGHGCGTEQHLTEICRARGYL